MKALLISAVLILSSNNVFAYVQPVHRVMTVHAFDQARAGLPEHLGLNSDQMLSAKQWMSDGANDEDNGTRSRNHFLSGSFGQPLEVIFPICLQIGSPADKWAISDGGYPIDHANQQYEAALNGPNPGTRSAHLKDLFITLGHEVHLVQDMAQPEHTRNDHHLPFP